MQGTKSEMCGGRTGGHERVDARTCADGVGARESWKWVERRASGHGCVRDSAGATEKLEMGREKEGWV